MKNTSLAYRTGVLAALMLFAAFVPPAVAQDWYPLVEGAQWNYRTETSDVTVPAGDFHVFRCWYADIAPGVGPVLHILPGMEMEWAELVSYDVPVRTEGTSLSGVKNLFRQ